MKFILLKISLAKTILRVISILMVFMPAIFNEKSFFDNYIGAWMLFWLIFFVIQVALISRYNINGSILFKENTIEIESKETKTIYELNNDLSIDINYKGIRGERIGYAFPLYLSLTNKDGVGDMLLRTPKTKKRYYFLVEKKQTSLYLKKIVEDYSGKGIKIELIKD